MNKNVIYILNKLKEKGFSAYLIGGSVRDIIMGNIPSDYDITTSATPDDIIKIFKNTIPTGIKHGTVTVIINNEKFELTTYRIEDKYINNRKPLSVTYTDSLYEDVKRRDFTINSIALDINNNYIDYFDGISDIKNKILQTVGNPDKRFTEDALRILRGVRFSSRYLFKIENNTYKAMKKNISLIKNISGERIFKELEIMFTENPFDAINILNDIGFFKVFDIEINEDNFKRIKNLHIKSFESVSSLLVSEHSIDLYLNILKCSNKIITKTMILIKSLNYNFSDKKSIKIFLNKYKCEEYFEDLLEVCYITDLEKCKVVKLYSDIINNNECYSLKNLNLSGDDLKTIGYEGKEIKFILNKLLYAVIDNPDLNKKEILSDMIKGI